MEDIKKLKEIELEIFRHFIEICNENSLRYFVVGGTALGAVRHKGFIPWDDDIDVALPRGDYEKFLIAAQKSLPSNMFLQTYITDKNYPNPFAKLRQSDTAFIEKSTSKIKMNHGVYVDIFPLDGYSRSGIKGKLLGLKEKILKISVASVFVSGNISKNKFRAIVKRAIARLLPDYRASVRCLDTMYKKIPYEDAEIIVNFCGAWAEKEIMPKAYFGDGIEGEFEGIKVVLPAKTHEYLTALYGDYMTLPPEEERVGHHYYTVIDLEKSYKEYINNANA